MEEWVEKQIEKWKERSEVWYISAPLRGEVEKNIERVKRAAEVIRGEGAKMEYPPFLFVPHLIIYPQALTISDEWGMKMCVEMVKRCDKLVLIGDKITDGMWDELKSAIESNVKIDRRVDL